MLAVHKAFIYYSAVHILIEAIVGKLSSDGCNAKDFLVTVDVSGFFGLLAWYMLSRVEDSLNFRIHDIYHSNLGKDGIIQYDHLFYSHSGNPLSK